MLPITEQENPNTSQIDEVSTLEALALINNEDNLVAAAVEKVLPQIAEAVDCIVERLEDGGRLFYVGTGTSGPGSPEIARSAMGSFDDESVAAFGSQEVAALGEEVGTGDRFEVDQHADPEVEWTQLQDEAFELSATRDVHDRVSREGRARDVEPVRERVGVVRYRRRCATRQVFVDQVVDFVR